MTEQQIEDPESPVSPEAQTGDPVRRWTLILLGLIVVLFIWHLAADRLTPYTSQARVHAFVIPIAAEVSGTVTDVQVAGNAAVNAGSELFRIEQDNYALAVSNAEASLQTARQGTGASSANVDAARAAVGSAEAALQKARLDVRRLRRIRDEAPGAISDRRLESSEANFVVSQQQLAGAEANLERALQDLGATGEDNSRIQQAQVALAQAQLNLERTIVRAPGAGVVTNVQVDSGNFAAAGRPQMTFISTADAWVRADFTENNLGHVDVGDTAELIFDVFPGRVFTGQVRSAGFGVSVDSAPLGSLPSISNDREFLRDAQRFPVEITFDMPDSNDRQRLRVGAQASVVIYADEGWLLRMLAKLHIRIAGLLSYAY
ncbi:MAG: HlyD family secretion protein [Pseudomonadales bacterium]